MVADNLQIAMAVTYLFFYRACKAQGLDRRTLPYYGRFQPYTTWFALIFECLVVLGFGYESFDPWSVSSFFIYYTMLILAPITFLGWKLVKRTKFVKPEEADLIWERPVIDAYEKTFIDDPVGFWREMIQLVGLGRKKGGNDKRAGSISA